MIHAEANYVPLTINSTPPLMDCGTHTDAARPFYAASQTKVTSSSTASISSLRRRSSAFVEIGLEGADSIIDEKLKRIDSRSRLQVRFRSEVEVLEPEGIRETVQFDQSPPVSVEVSPSKTAFFQAPSFAFPSMPRLFLFALLLAVALPSLNNAPFFNAGVSPIGATAGPIKPSRGKEIRRLPDELVRRADSPTNICTRWSQQTAIINNTLYIYGGRASTTGGQTSDTWSKLRLELADSLIDQQSQTTTSSQWIFPRAGKYPPQPSKG